jgi:ribosomal protein S27AE
MNHSTDASAASPSALECPRCGHLVGAMADEADRRGETHGKCGECGLDIEWSTLRRTALAPPWLVEARYSPRNIVRRAFGTLLRTARPFRFWESIDLSLALSRRRLLVFMLAVLAALHCLAASQRILSRGWKPWATPPAASAARGPVVLAPLPAREAPAPACGPATTTRRRRRPRERSGKGRAARFDTPVSARGL